MSTARKPISFRASDKFRAAALAAIGSLLGLGLSLGADMLLVFRFGARAATDAYFAGMTLPIVLASVLGSSATFTFVPRLAAAIERRAQACAGLFWDVFAALCAIGFGCALLLFCFSDQLVSMAFSGLADETRALAAAVVRRLAILVPCATLAEFLSAAHYLRSSVLIVSVGRLVQPFLLLACLLLDPVPTVLHLATATALGSLVQALLLTVTLTRKEEFRFSGRERGGAVLRHAAATTLPMMAAMLLYRCVPVMERSFLSRYPPGSISAVGFASRIFQAAAGILGVGLVASLLRPLNELAARNEWGAMADTVERGCRVLLYAVLPTVLLYLAVGDAPLRLALGRGLSTSALQITHLALCLYLVALPAAVLGSVLGQALYALNQARQVAAIGVAEAVLYVLACLALRPVFGIAAMPTAFAVHLGAGLLVNLVQINGCLRRRKTRPIRLSQAFVRDLMLAFAVALPVGIVRRAFGAGDLSASMFAAIGGAAYLGLSWVLPGFPELGWILSSISVRPRGQLSAEEMQGP